MTQAESITLNGTTYPIADLNDAAKAQVNNIRLVDVEISHLNRQLAFAQTARNAFVQALASAMGVAAGSVPATPTGSAPVAPTTLN